MSKTIKYRVYIKHLKLSAEIVSINFVYKEVEVDLADGNGDNFPIIVPIALIHPYPLRLF